jgi:TolB protein
MLSQANDAEAQVKDCRLVYKADGKEAAYPRLSADNKRILYQSNESGKWHLFIMDTSGKKHQQLTEGTSNNNFPDWSADNRLVAFVSNRDGNEEIYLVKTDGTELKRITTDKARDIHPYFSPDGKCLLFNSTRGNGSLDIYRYNLASGNTARLTSTEDQETCARYSPDMKTIVFLRNNEEMDDIFLMEMETSMTRYLTNTPFKTDGWPMFGPDSKWIYYSSMDPGTYCMFRIREDGTSREQLSRAEEGEEHARVFISRTGHLLIFNRRIGRTIEIRSCSINS